MSGVPLPTEQFAYEDLPELSAEQIYRRRERTFLLLAGLFLGTLTMLNIIGVTKIVDLSFSIGSVHVPFEVPVGVLPYPLTFLCTDFISELYGRGRANWLVIVGFILNIWVFFILWLGGVLPGFETQAGVFSGMQAATMSTVAASMVAYLFAQLIDVRLFHFWKDLTKGRHLWLRNNGSTLVSQAVDTVAVLSIVYATTSQLPVKTVNGLIGMMAASYVFKMVAALVDTLPFYLGVAWLSRFLRVPPPHAV